MRYLLEVRPIAAAATKVKLGFRRQRARSAQRRRDWTAALDLWRRCAETAPEDRAAAIGYIGCLIYTGDLDEAARLAEAFISRNPADANGPISLARIAEARGDTPAAIGFWRSALDLRPGHLQSLIRLGAALLSDRRWEEAALCATQLTATYRAEPYGLVLHAQIRQEAFGIEEASPLWRSAANTFGSNIHFLHAYGRALSSAGMDEVCLEIAEKLRALDVAESWRLRGQVLTRRQPYQDHTSFWQAASAELPDNIDITRKLLHAALWARRIDQAETALDRLLEQRQVRAADADYVIGLGHMHLGLGNKTAARAAVRHFMRAMRSRFDYRAAALRLDRMILSCFPRRPDATLGLAQDKERFVTIVRKARLTPDAKSSLEQIAELESALRSSGTLCLFDTDIDPQCCRLFVDTVLDRLAHGEAFSLIRLGDGEANALDYGSEFADRFDEDAAARERIWWGRTLDSEARSNLAGRVRTAIDGADCVGIPLTARFLRDIRLKTGPALLATRTGRGLLSIMRMLERRLVTRGFEGTLLTSAHLHQDLERWNLYGELLGGGKEIVLISCHATLPDKLRSRFGTTVVKHVITPPGDAMLEMQARSLRDEEVPLLSLQHALQELGEWPRGRLVLVGAGYAGKVIVEESRRRGGVALDLGSIFDHWMGLSTRSYQDLA
jgi:tetratricopeptide (TPR) repeat protein